MSITNSTFVGNASGYQGGAIYTNATVTVTNSTFSGNSSANGGGIRSEFGNVSLQNSIVANSPAGGNCDATFGVIAGLGNLSWPDATCPGINQDPMLGPLADNGGPTQTMALPSGSPAIDAAVLANCPATDQRGVSRPQGGGCDIGAYERVGYTFTGFFSPVRNPPTFNTAKAGSSVPVKFSLGGNQGLNIFAAGYPKSQQITPCNTSGALVDGTPATAGTLSYDPASDRYTYLWKTDKAWAMTCRKLTVRLSDNSDHVAYFNFTK
ncbi:MAG TPA: PxKF domain-containing protein [Gaiellaceae bacterium]|jgi:predicted outer membrane repeat protein|nr:PxKF domain-containing protein [Gaiellaceae bacterium]